MKPGNARGLSTAALLAVLVAAPCSSASAAGDEPPSGLSRAEWRQIRREVAASGYHARRLPGPGSSVVVQASNARQRYGATFRSDGIAIVPQGAGSGAPDAWRLALDVTGYGYAGDLRRPPAAAPQADKERIEYRRGGLTEWYVNRPAGLEQGFLIQEPEARRAEPLVVSMAVRGGMDVVPRDGGAAFVDRSGRTALSYTGLKAWDADGRPLGSRIEVDGGEIRLAVDAAGARFPVTVDPIFLNEWVLYPHGEPGEIAGTGFGSAVSLDQDTVAVGAFNEPGPTGAATGAAYIFVRSGGVWTAQQRLVDPDGSFGDHFGSSISLSGGTLVVGAPDDDAAIGPSDVGSVTVFVLAGGAWTVQQKIQTADGGTGDQFGFSVGLYGDTLVAGAPSADAGATDRGAAYVFVRSGTTWTEQQKLTASDGAADDAFGSSVSLFGDTAVAGAPKDDTPGGADTGSAYVFVRSGATWTEQQKLTAADATSGDALGSSVSVFLDTVAAGAPQDLNSQGSAYVFVRSGATWTEQQKLTASDGAVGDTFGASIAAWAETVVVGAPLDASIVGAAYAFVRSGATWTEQQKLVSGGGGGFFGVAVSLYADTAVVGAHASGTGIGTAHAFVRSGANWFMQQFLQTPYPTGSDAFGTSVSGSGDTAAVGAPLDETPSGSDAGSAYVFVRTGSVWEEQALLRASDAAAGDAFGSSVAVDGDTAVVGAPGDDTTAGTDAGSAYVFVRTGTVWTEQQKLTPAGAASPDRFGSSVAVSGDTVVVGAPGHDTAGGADAGTAYVFVRIGTVWTEQQPLSASDGAADDTLGAAVSLDGDTAAVGAPGDDGPGVADAGSAYVFVRSGTTWSEQQKLVGSDTASGDALGSAVSVSGDTAAIGAPQSDATAADAGAAYVFVRSGTTWTEEQELTASDGLASDAFGSAVSVSGNMAVVGAPAGDAPGVPDAGAMYQYERAGTAWTEGQKLFNGPGIAAGDAFAGAVAMDGGVAVGGAPGDDLAGGADSGSATVYRRYTFVDLGVTKTDGLTTAAPGQVITYTITVSNAGADAAMGAAVTDAVPAVLLAPTWTCTATPGSSCTPSGAGNINDTVTLLVGGTATYLLTATVNPAGSGSIVNTATATPPLGALDVDPSDNSATDTDTIVPAADLSVTKTDSPDPVQPGGALVYMVTVANAGPSTATAVTLVDTLPAGVTFVSSVPGPPTCTLAGSTLTCNLGSLAAAANATVSINTTVNATGGILANTASASAAEADPDSTNNSALASTGVGPRDGELRHGFDEVFDLAALPGPVPTADEDVFRISQKPYTSYEVLVEGTSGDIGTGSGPLLERIGPDGTTVVQPSLPVGAGPTRSLRWANTTGSIVEDEAVRVRSVGCTTDCGADDVYRIRVYETTYSVPRFNNAGTQVTVLVLQNPNNYPIAGEAYFRNAAGALVATHPFSVGPKAALIVNTATIPGAAGVSGAITVAHDGRYGDLFGKTVALEPATGFSFDSALDARPK